MDISFYTLLIAILVLIMSFLMRRHGWVVLWNGFFIFILLFVLVLAQKHLGKIEGLLLAVIPFIAGQMLIKKNRKVNIFYFAKQTKFIHWLNKNIYHIVYTENYPKEKSARAKRRKNKNKRK